MPRPLPAVLAVLLGLVLLVTALWSVPRERRPPGGAPWFGVLQVGRASAEPLAGKGLDRAVVGLDWSRYEPRPGRADPGYVAQAAKLVGKLRAEGIGAVLDPGLHHPPPWVFALPGATRFRDQYGVRWFGSAVDGTAVANAVFDTAVRSAEGDYLRRIAADFGGAAFTAVRVGGLLSGELRYPPADDGAGHHDAIWYFDSDARGTAPVPGWRPGRGGRAEAERSVLDYLGALTDYERWLLRVTAASFPKAQLQLLLPGWGLRPGQVAAAVDDDLDGRSQAERGGMLSSGLAWDGQVRALGAYRARALAYTTWLDAPSGGRTPQLVSPAEYLAGLTAAVGVPLAGENTGQNATRQAPRDALRLCLSRVRALRLAGMMWMGEPDLLSGRAGLTLTDYADAVSAFRARRSVN
ncbi:hypothetical protein ACFOSC_10475 [Streptantibioticus rubrisoli]|uniref:hypothetical protein n=1 Tax=Streptantibioticus rubrisoli TaxID=1387313 RepID=UPI0026E59A3C|nr:hypothetical protein [Streptantibioticus rubrisoli]